MDANSEGEFKWFGEGFDGFPKRLPEDVVEYIIFVIDTKLSDTQTRERLQAFQRALAQLEKKFLKEYIWQRDSISLDLLREDGRWVLKGSTNYGDSIADEWLIVYFLRELSKEFKDAWIRVYDTDGEFLLIEAANALPKWLNPEVAENRVWINQHHLHVIPLSKNENPKSLQLQEALSLISGMSTTVQCLSKVEEEAFHRLKGYPAAISENQHHATLPLPRKVAHILHTNPSYIAPAVEAFYLRDPISLRLLQPAKSSIPHVFNPEDFVVVSVRFTKVLYAQLLGQNWTPPEPWSTSVGELTRQGYSQDKAELAIKVSTGMEMLLQHSLYANKRAVREIQLLLDDLKTEDEQLPTDAEIDAWPTLEDDEGWLNIDFSEFEKELAGKGGAGMNGFGDKKAQENLRKMVERFNAFMEGEDAGIDGVGGFDPMDEENDSDQPRDWEDPEDSDTDDQNDNNDERDDEYADREFEEYERVFEKFMALSSAEKSALTDDARELARTEEAEQEEDEEIRRLSKLMESELFSHGALNLGPAPKSKSPASKTISIESSDKGKGKTRLKEVQDLEDEDDDELLDEDYNLAENMLNSYKSQVGMAGPAGNLMGLMGVQLPPDADDESEEAHKGP